jgi:chromate transporter
MNLAALREVAFVFLRLGATAFGGPAAHIALMEEEFVRRRAWLTHGQFLDLIGAVNVMPGPNSTKLAIQLGYLRAGWPGLIIAGTCFILPSALMVSVLAWVYVVFGHFPEIAGLLYGVKPVIIVIVLQALVRLGRSALRTRWLALAAGGALLANVLGVHELVVLVATGIAVALVSGIVHLRSPGLPPASLLSADPGSATSIGAAAGSAAVVGGVAAPFGLWPLFLVFLKIGAVLFGSGYVLLAFLRADLVERLGWLQESELLDAVAIGQVTPGPVSTTATFIDYVLGEKHGVGGPAGAAIATVGIFLPSFVFVALSGPLIPRIRAWKSAGDVLDGVNVASLALMAVVTWDPGRAALVDVPSILIAIVSAALLFYWRINSVWLVLAGAALGIARVLLGLAA